MHIYNEDETLFVESDTLYDRVCLDFHFSNWHQYFDVTNAPVNSEFCDRVREVES